MKFRSWLANLLYDIYVVVKPSDTVSAKDWIDEQMPDGAKLADAASMNLSPDMVALQAFHGLLAAGWEVDAAAGASYTSAIVAFFFKREEYWQQVISTASLTPWLIPSSAPVD